MCVCVHAQRDPDEEDDIFFGMDPRELFKSFFAREMGGGKRGTFIVEIAPGRLA